MYFSFVSHPAVFTPAFPIPTTGSTSVALADGFLSEENGLVPKPKAWKQMVLFASRKRQTNEWRHRLEKRGVELQAELAAPGHLLVRCGACQHQGEIRPPATAGRPRRHF